MAEENFISTLINMLSGGGSNIPPPSTVAPPKPVLPQATANTEGQDLYTSGVEGLKQYMPELSARVASKFGVPLAHDAPTNPMYKTLEQLRSEAGSRGFMLLGRHVPGDSKETIGQIMSRLPSDSPDVEGMSGLANVAAGAAGASAPLVARVAKPMREAASNIGRAEVGETTRTLGSKVFRSLNLDEPAKAFEYLAKQNVNPRELQVLTSSQGGRAGILLPNGNMIFRATHGEAAQAIPTWAKAQTDPIKNMLLDVKTPHGRALLTVEQLEKLRLMHTQ